MPTHQQFLDAISAAPNDWALRLMYADWLEEQGDPLGGEWRKPMVRIRMELGGPRLPTGELTNHGYGDGIVCGRASGDGEGSGLDLSAIVLNYANRANWLAFHEADMVDPSRIPDLSLGGDGSGDGHGYGYGHGYGSSFGSRSEPGDGGLS